MQRRTSTPGPSAPRLAGLPEDVYIGLSAVLWDERIVLDQVLYKLVQQQYVVTSGQTRWLAQAEDELRRAVERVAEYEVLRAVEVDTIAQLLEAPDGLRLREICELAASPWDEILGDHREALRVLVGEVEAQSTTNGRLLGVGSDDARRTLDRVGHAATPQLAVADASYRSALETILRVRQLSLADFLI